MAGIMFARVKRRGNSFVLTVPADVFRGRGVRDGDVVEVELRRKVPPPEELGGTVKF